MTYGAYRGPPYAVVGAIVLNHSGDWPLRELYSLDGLLAAERCGGENPVSARWRFNVSLRRR